MEYTKGEWYWEYNDQMHHNLRAKSTHPSGCEEDKHILFIAPDFLGENSLINEADAHLIVSAPELYEALGAILNSDTIRNRDNFNNALEALAKAEGK